MEPECSTSVSPPATLPSANKFICVCLKTFTPMTILHQTTSTREGSPSGRVQHGMRGRSTLVQKEREMGLVEATLLAQWEADYQGISRQINIHLAEKAGRTVDSIKGRRKQAAHKALLVQLLETREGADTTAEDCHHTIPFEDPPPNSAPPWINGTPEIFSFSPPPACPTLPHLTSIIPSPPALPTPSSVSSPPCTATSISEDATHGPTSNPLQNASSTTNDPVIEALLTTTLTSPDNKPSMKSPEAFFGDLFEDPLPPDEDFMPPARGNLLYDPISMEEIREVIKINKSGAVGPDELSMGIVRQWPGDVSGLLPI